MTMLPRHPGHLLMLAMIGFAAPGLAAAGPAYKASDIVEHFAPKKDLGNTRALCFGTETECAKAVSEASKPVDAFDLRINFDYNSAQLTPSARANLAEFARALADSRLAGARFLVEGHTDSTGSDTFNLDLSMRRASSVVSYLTAHGIKESRLEAKGYGKQKPLVTDPASPENRRVETRLLGQ